MAIEGYGILADGTTYLDNDDSGFGPKNGGPGDGFYKFVPTNPYAGSAPITDLSQSPYVAGEVYGLPWFSEFGFEQTRAFRALKVWSALRLHGPGFAAVN